METSLEVLNKTQRVTPPDALYNKIMESISDRADIKNNICFCYLHCFIDYDKPFFISKL